MTKQAPAAAGTWRNRIVGHADIPPGDLVPNPSNWRTHPPEQERALVGALAEVGWVTKIIVNRGTGNVVDGQLRIELALAKDEATVPVTYVELTDDEERLVLASLDPIGAMADAETMALESLIADLSRPTSISAPSWTGLAGQHGTDTAYPGLVDPDEAPIIQSEPVRHGRDVRGG